MGKIEIYKDSADLYRFRIKASNGEIIAVSESYTSKQNCQKGIDSVKENVNSNIFDLTVSSE